MRDTTLIITAWRRPDYLARALASWAAVPDLARLGWIVIALGRGHEPAMEAAIVASGRSCSPART